MNRLAIVSFALALGRSLLFASPADIPLRNWTVPPYRASGASSGLAPMFDISPGVGFVAVQPCRVVDTRGGGVFTGNYGPPILMANATRSFDIDSAPHCPGISAGVTAYSLNFTVTQTAGPIGDIRVWPTGAPPIQITSVLNWTVPNATVANATIIPAGAGGSIDVQVAGSNTHLLIDVNGYFTDEYNPGTRLVSVSHTGGAAAILGVNNAAVDGSHAVGGFAGGAARVHGVQGEIAAAATPYSSGVHGISASNSAQTFGVFGEVTAATPHSNSAGVYGQIPGPLGVGVIGFSPLGKGVYGQSNAATNGAVGVLGNAAGSSGYTFGVKGIVTSQAADSAGVKGVSGWGDPLGDELDCSPCFTAGVRGTSSQTGDNGYGVLGISRGAAVGGILLTETGNGVDAAGYLGKRFGNDPDSFPDPPWAVFADGAIGSTNLKYFVEPHPSDPSLTIRYVALEGPEAGTYFRGVGRFQNGLATIDVPEDFRLVTAPEGLSIQVTPIGEMATVAVLRIGLDGIVVRGSRNVAFFYTVNGVRRSFPRLTPIARGSEFVPSKPDATMPNHLSEEQKRVLIANGTYRPDGTVNRDTARRLGWDRAWEEGSWPAPRAAAESEAPQ